MGSSSSKFNRKTGILSVPLPEILAGTDISKFKRRPSQILKEDSQRIDDLKKKMDDNKKELNRLSKNVDELKDDVEQEELVNAMRDGLTDYKYNLIPTGVKKDDIMLKKQLSHFPIDPSTRQGDPLLKNDDFGSKKIDAQLNRTDDEIKKSNFDRYSHRLVKIPQQTGGTHNKPQKQIRKNPLQKYKNEINIIRI